MPLGLLGGRTPPLTPPLSSREGAVPGRVLTLCTLHGWVLSCRGHACGMGLFPGDARGPTLSPEPRASLPGTWQAFGDDMGQRAGISLKELWLEVRGHELQSHL